MRMQPAMTDPRPAATLPDDVFAARHIGPRPAEVAQMLALLGAADLDQLIDEAVPPSIRLASPLDIGAPLSEHEALARLRGLADRNGVLAVGADGERTRRPAKSFIGLGYHGTLTPPVILRNIIENPGWYTQYTPYQPEISQGRLEAMLNFQTMVVDLTALDIANASMLDEATAAAEAMTMCHRLHKGDGADSFLVADDCHPQTIAVLRTRAEPLGIRLVIGDPDAFDFAAAPVFGCLMQYPNTDGRIRDLRAVIERAHAAEALVVLASDLLALTLLTPPGELGADVAVGSAQRFGVPLGFGGPHAAFMATREAYQRQLPGRLVGVSIDAEGRPGLRLTLQTREQHIRRDRATSNICTAQVLLAVVASMYAVYHGPGGLTRIATNVRRRTCALRRVLSELGAAVDDGVVFDTLRVAPPVGRAAADIVRTLAAESAINVRLRDEHGTKAAIGIALDETTTNEDLAAIARAFGGGADVDAHVVAALAAAAADELGAPFARTSPFLTHEVFNTYTSETEMQRYMRRLEARDLSLTTSMIPLGSCTMKLNAAAEMLPITWPLFADIHPFAPDDQSIGYRALFAELEADLAAITGFDAVSLQPNAGSQGEYAGLLVIRAWQHARGAADRDICLIPTSAHGTNPASAVMAGLKVVPVACDEQGNIDVADLQAKIDAHADALAALMLTYPSTHGVFESTVVDICGRVHAAGGQVYLDGANMNALVGLARPADFGADVCHLNLHKTFCIPHGGGGPGMGPIGVKAHLAPFLPGHPLQPAVGGARATGPVAAAPWSSASILPIPYAYIKMMGGAGLTEATKIAILNANYIARRLQPHYPVVFTGAGGRVAHECIIDLRGLKASAGIEAEDVAKRLMDYGFHAPTMSWPVAGTLMIEPTESESQAELDRFCEAMIAIRDEVRAIESGRIAAADSPLKHAPHTAAAVTADAWDRAYTRAQAAFPAPWLRAHKFWPPTARIDNVYGDRNIVCVCPPMEAYAEAPAGSA
ncbi:MAG: aminomethyl-transferring glycine dehydrogenase [Ardenticatenales bacterium]|nr:aminomethyl-transferring glycine dehydrogenase [Ardenticatenales bacterium]